MISKEQSAFLPERLITDNIIAAFEMTHAIKRRKTEKAGAMAIKLDMSKAYERVKWGFLRGMMEKLGFEQKWISIIMKCISMVSYSVTMNGERSELFCPTRGLRQGDPLSPYLFLLCADGFSALLNDAALRGRLGGISVCKKAPKLTHLLFADDSISFCRAEIDDCRELCRILEVYERASGQKVNMDKSSIFISPNVDVAKKRELMECLGIHSVLINEKYLGLPMILGKSKKEFFGNIKERIWKRIKGWNEKLLSKAGREVLVKSIVQAIPTYAMSCFLFPKFVLNEIRSMMANYWWGQRKGERKLHWVSWKKLCNAKSRGGLRFRDFKDFNLALLAKQGWRIIQNPNSLVRRILKARYFPNCSFLEATAKKNSSFLWRSIVAAKPLLKEGCFWRVGNGQSVKVWKDVWGK